MTVGKTLPRPFRKYFTQTFPVCLMNQRTVKLFALNQILKQGTNLFKMITSIALLNFHVAPVTLYIYLYVMFTSSITIAFITLYLLFVCRTSSLRKINAVCLFVKLYLASFNSVDVITLYFQLTRHCLTHTYASSTRRIP